MCVLGESILTETWKFTANLYMLKYMGNRNNTIYKERFNYFCNRSFRIWLASISIPKCHAPFSALFVFEEYKQKRIHSEYNLTVEVQIERCKVNSFLFSYYSE